MGTVDPRGVEGGFSICLIADGAARSGAGVGALELQAQQPSRWEDVTFWMARESGDGIGGVGVRVRQAVARCGRGSGESEFQGRTHGK